MVEVKVECVVSLIAYLNKLNWFVQVHTCICENTRLWSLSLPTSPSTRLISFPGAALANCRIIWQSTLYEHILLNCCNFLFAIHLSLQRLAPQLCIRNSCCGVLGWSQYRKDARMKWWENVLLPAKQWRYGKWDWYCSGCKGKCCTWKIQCFMVSIIYLFLFFFPPRCPEALKPGNDFCRQQESSASSF